VTDVWYPDAMLLRARWRLNLGRDRERLAAEALRIVDAAWLLSRDLELGLVRLRLGAALPDEDVLVESARHLVAVFLAALARADANAAALSPAQEALVERSLGEVSQALERELSPRPRRRAESVLAAARGILRRLDR
jgi:hypothetical protein